MNILLVDDNQDYLLPMKAALYSHGYTVFGAEDGQVAHQIMGVAKFDLIISDIKMPNVDGIQFHQLVRKMQHYAQTKFIFISGCRDSYGDRLQLNPGRDFFLDKTTPASEIIKYVDKLIFGKYAEVWV